MNTTKGTAFAGLGCRPIINASGKMTALGASTVTDAVAEALHAASQDFVDIDELLLASGKVIAEATGAGDGCPTTGAASAIVLSVAAAVTKGHTTLVEAIPHLPDDVPTEILIQKGHAVHFGAAITQMVRLGGGTPVEVGHANLVEREHIEQAIGPNTAGLLYIKSHHAVQKGMQTLEVMRDLAHGCGLPLLVDAAAEEDFRKYIDLGADLVMYSGAKALNGPTSGFLCGRADLVEAARTQYTGVGRPMKVGKEATLGLCQALRDYAPDASTVARQKRDMEQLVTQLEGVPGLAASVTQDEAGRDIYRVSVTVDPGEAGTNALQLTEQLRSGIPAVYTRDHWASTGRFDIDPRPLQPGDTDIIAQRIKEVVVQGGLDNE